MSCTARKVFTGKAFDVIDYFAPRGPYTKLSCGGGGDFVDCCIPAGGFFQNAAITASLGQSHTPPKKVLVGERKTAAVACRGIAESYPGERGVFVVIILL